MSEAVLLGPGQAATRRRRTIGALTDIAIGLALVVGSVALRYVVGPDDVINDGYTILLSGLHVLAGDVPGVDYVASPYEVLSYWASLELHLGNLGIGVDFFMSAIFFGVGAACVYAAGRLLGLSRLQAIYAPLIVLLLYPRLYNYFKILTLGILVLSFALYFRKPDPRRAAILGVATSFCLLIRLDIGFYAAVGSGLAILVAGSYPFRRLLRQVAVFAVAFAPLAILAFSLTVWRGHGLATPDGVGASLVDRAEKAIFPFRVLSRLPPYSSTTLSMPSYTIDIRYAADVSDEQRQTFEQEHRLEEPRLINDQPTWEYTINWYDRAGLKSIVLSPLVDDTFHIDRVNYVLSGVPIAWYQARSVVAYLFSIPIDGVIARAVYVVLYFGLLWVVVALFVDWWRSGRKDFRAWLQKSSSSKILLVLLWMSFFSLPTLVRNSWDSRLPDIGPVFALTLVYQFALISAALRSRIGSIGSSAVFHGVLLIFTAMVFTYGARYGRLSSVIMTVWGSNEPLTEVVRNNIDGLDHLAPGSVATDDTLRGQRAELARYIALCTAPTDRLLQTFFMPEIPFWSDRLMAGGRLFYHATWGPGGLSEEEGIARLEQQDVPIALGVDLEGDSVDWQYFRGKFPETAAYIEAHYRQVAVSTFSNGPGLRFIVFVRNDLDPATTYEAAGGDVLPCPSPQIQ